MEVGKLKHSQSQPGLINRLSRTPPLTPKKNSKMLALKVQMLDDSVTIFQVQSKALGRVLFEQVCNQLDLLESDYFGLEYQESGGTKYWIDLEKPLCRQLGLSLVGSIVRFCVKFYPPDPSQLEEEFTRYLFCLQIKRDLSQGVLLCNSSTAALMASYIVQAEYGDYSAEEYPDQKYLSAYKFVPNQDEELERRIMENHKKHVGQTPAEADLNLLETARRCELYGINMHPAKDHEGCPLNLAVAHMGIVVFQNFSKINTFSWIKIRKISFKRKKFLIKLHPEGYGYYKDTVEFFFEGRNECKNFWKKCVENHGFFRCPTVKKIPRQKTRVLSRGSSFRYSGRTQKQIVDYVRENYVKRQSFQRSQSFRHSSSAHSSVANVGTSISAHPLLPLGDNAVVGTPASLSCGSMTLTSSPVHIADIHAGGSPSPQLTTSVSQGTSVTSSPQHFYPQETQNRRADHQLTKVKRPHVHSQHAISPLHSPTDAKSAANHSANHSNSTIGLVSSDILSSHSSLKSPEFMTYSDVYSNCYTYLRDCGNSDNKLINGTKTDTFDKASNAKLECHESIKSFSKNCEAKVCGSDHDDEGYKRHRSGSCRDIYNEENVADRKSERVLKRTVGTPYESREKYDKSRRKCYSALASNTSVDHPNDSVSDMRIYSSSYPGTMSSLSTESPEGELIEVLNKKYDSQEDVALSHDDVSHDSYELLERELDYNNETRNKRSRMITESERARSCSWGSDRGDLISPLNFRSTENVIGSDCATGQNFWSLEREKNSKHRSEIDFRSFNHSQKTKKLEENTYEGKTKISEFLDYNNRFRKLNVEMDLEQFDNLIFNSKDFVDKRSSRDLHLPPREDRENFKALERKNYHSQRKSLEKIDLDVMFKIRVDDRKRSEKKREKREKEEKFHEGFKEREQKRQVWREEEESGKKIVAKPNDYINFQEIHFKKFDRVVSNQFGKYPEFQAQGNDFIAQEKVLENYEKIRQVGRIAKELKKSEGTSAQLLDKSPESIRDSEVNNLKQELEIEQLQMLKKRSMGLANAKFGKAHVERTKSDPYNSLKNQKRNTLMHQKSIDLTPQQSEETASDYDDDGYKKTSRSEHDIPYVLHKRHFMNGTARNADLEVKMAFKPLKPSQKEAKVLIKKIDEDSGLIKKFEEPSMKSFKLAEAKKAGVQIINLDLNNSSNISILEPKIIGKAGKSSAAKKSLPKENKTVKKETKKIECTFEHTAVKQKDGSPEKHEEPIYAEVCKEKILEENIPPEPPARTSSVGQKLRETSGVETRSSTEKKSSLIKILEGEDEKKTGKSLENKEDTRGKQELLVVQRREESLTLFARTRLGLSEGSAFTPIARQTNIGSPVSQRRTKSLDAPYVSVHSLPPADAFSSKDDTVDGNETDVVNAAVARFKEIGRKLFSEKSDKKCLPPDTESEVDSVFTDDGGVDNTFKKTVENQSKIDVLPEERVLDAVRGKRLLSKIESVDFIDSEGDMDSSKLAEPVPIPSDRLVNLPESIRFPSVRQISGQTSEESADGWEQKEVKVKRRTPRRSLGREEQDIKESVVWDSKDDAPDDDVWDDSLPLKYESSGPSTEYLKRGSCGQSIDDDNLSTPIKESSPEHWVSVDDLPEALEREEKLLRQQEKILREKILNEKLKRELNLDTINVDERFCENLKQKYEEETASLKENFKGHSLDTYELTEKKLREKGNKNSSLDEDLLGNKKSMSKMLQPSNYQGMDYIQCKVVKDVAEIDQFGDNDEELEEFFVLLDQNLEKEDANGLWDEDSSFRKTVSNDESLISVPEEFKDEKEESYIKEVKEQSASPKMVEIRFSKDQKAVEDGENSYINNTKDSKVTSDGATLSPYSGSRRGSEENRKLSLTEESGRLSPYDNCSRRSSGDVRKLSCENGGRVSPFDDSRRGSDDPRRLSMSEDSRKCSASESVSEETRRRLSSTEETRRKRASLTKQCSVGAESISDDVISGIQERSSSFEQDEKDVFEESNARPDTLADSVQAESNFEVEISEGVTKSETNVEKNEQVSVTSHLALPESTREFSRETEDSVDYCELDLKEITEVVKEKDISGGSSFEKNESLEGDEVQWNINKTRGSAPEIIVSKSKDAVGAINEGITIINTPTEEGKVQSLTRTSIENASLDKQRPTVPKTSSKPKPLTPKPIDNVHKKLMKVSVMESPVAEHSSNALKSSLDSSQESDLDRLSDFSLITHVQNQIVRRNLSDTGKCLRRDQFEEKIDEGISLSQRTSSDEREKTESSSFEMKSSADENADEGKRKGTKGEKLGLISYFERSKTKNKRSPDQEKRDSGEDGSSSSSAPANPKRELSSTWKPFLLESSGSSSLEEGWLPPDENAHLADEEETSSTSNNQQDDSYHDDADYPTGVGYPVLNMPSAEMMVSGYSSVYALSRTLSRISERSTSEQDRSDEDDITKPSSRSVSAEEESLLSSDHQPSLSSDPPSPKESSTIPDLPVDRTVPEPFGDTIPPPVPEEDWPSPPSSSSVIDTQVVSHIETFYMEIHPEVVRTVVVAEPQNEANSSSDENQTLLEESENVHFSSDMSLSTTTTTQDGTVVVPVRPRSSRTGSISEDASISTSEWQSPSRGMDPCSVSLKYSIEDVQISKIPPKIKPLKVMSPTGKNFGFFETPVSKVRSPTSQTKFFEADEKPATGYSSLRSPSSRSETTSPKNYGSFFDGQNKTRSSSKGKSVCTPYYCNVTDSAEKSYFGRYDTGSLERTKIQSSRKYCSYYSVPKTVPNDGDSSNSDGPPVTSPNTIPRASRKIKRRHRVAMDLVICDGKIVAPPKTKTTVLENSDSDRSSPREFHSRESKGKQANA